MLHLLKNVLKALNNLIQPSLIEGDRVETDLSIIANILTIISLQYKLDTCGYKWTYLA